MTRTVRMDFSGDGRGRIAGASPAPRPHRPRFVAGIVVLAVAVGCRSVDRAGTEPASSQRGSPAPGVDPTRAYLPLAKIEPILSPPRRPDSVPPLSSRAVREIEEAGRLIEEQRYTEAAIELQKALRYDPNHPEIHRTLAMLHWEAGNIERAKTHAEKALEGNPDSAASHYVLGRCRASAGDRAAALIAYRTAPLCSDFAASPQTAALCHYHLAEVLAKEGYLDAALAEYAAFDAAAAGLDAAVAGTELRSLIQAGPRATADARSKLLEQLGRYAEAAAALAPLIDERNPDPALGVRHVRLLIQGDRLDEALAAVRRLPAERDDVFSLLFEIHQKAGRPDRVLDDLRARIAARPDDTQLILQLADVLTRLGRSDEAQREIEAALQKDPSAIAVRMRRVDLALAASRWNDAVQVSAAGIEHAPDQANEFARKLTPLASNDTALTAILSARPPDSSAADDYLRGLLASSAGRTAEAETLLQASRTRWPDFLPGRVALAGLYLRECRYDDVLRIAARAKEAAPEDARLEMILGQTHERLDDAPRAETHFRAVTQLDRNNVDAMLALARLYRQSGQMVRAQRQLRVLLEEHPNHEAAIELLAYTYLDEQKRDAAIEQYELLARIAVEARTRERCAALLDQVRKAEPDLAGYRRVLLDVVKRHGADAAVWIAIAESYTDDDDVAEKREAYRKALAADPSSEEATIGSAQTSVRMLDFEEAAAQLKAALRRRPNRYPWMLSTGERGTPGLIELYWLLPDYGAALDLAERAASREGIDDTWRRRFRLAIVETLRLSGRPDDAVGRLKKWVDEAPGDRAWGATLALEYLRQDRPAEAVPIWESLHQASPHDRDTLRELIRALMDAKRYDRAAQYLLRWLDDDPENELALRWLVTVLGAAERFDDALELIRSRLIHTLSREELQQLAVTLLNRAERFPECLDLIEGLFDETSDLIRAHLEGREGKGDEELPRERLVRRPNEPFTMDRLQGRILELRLLRVAVLIESKEYRTAEEELQSWLDAAQSPEERYRYLLYLADCRRRQGNDLDANEVMARALALRPADPMMNNNVAYAWIDHGVRLDEAERMIRFALSREPRQPAFLDTFGWLLYKRGEFAESVKWLLRGRAGRGEDPVIHDHLGDAYWRLGRHDEAVSHWESAAAAASKVPLDRLENNADERRVQDVAPRKIEDARAGRDPAVAPLAGP